MAAAGELLAGCLDLLAAEAREGVQHPPPRRDRRGVHPRGRRGARLQGLPRLPRLDLRVGQRQVVHGSPAPTRSARATSSRSTRASCSTGGWPTRPARSHRRDHRRGGPADRRDRGLALARHRGGAGGQPGRRHRPRRADRGRGRRLLGGAEPGRPRGRPLDARGAAGAELRPARHGGAAHRARRRHRHRAHGQRRRPRGGHGARRLDDLEPRRVPLRPRRAHRGDHRRRPANPHAARPAAGRRRGAPSGRSCKTAAACRKRSV